MEASDRTRILVVAKHAAATPPLIEHLKERAARGPVRVTLLVPAFPRATDPEGEETEKALELAVPLLEDALGDRVESLVGPPDAFLAVQHALERERFDEVVVSALPERVSRWLRRDLPRRIRRLGVPVTVIKHPQARRVVWETSGPAGYTGP